jgi:hypothetical protein
VADNAGGGGNSLLGVIVGALLVLVIGAGAFMYFGHHSQPSASLNVTVPSPTTK